MDLKRVLLVCLIRVTTYFRFPFGFHLSEHILDFKSHEPPRITSAGAFLVDFGKLFVHSGLTKPKPLPFSASRFSGSALTFLAFKLPFQLRRLGVHSSFWISILPWLCQLSLYHLSASWSSMYLFLSVLSLSQRSSFFVSFQGVQFLIISGWGVLPCTNFMR